MAVIYDKLGQGVSVAEPQNKKSFLNKVLEFTKSPGRSIVGEVKKKVRLVDYGIKKQPVTTIGVFGGSLGAIAAAPYVAPLLFRIGSVRAAGMVVLKKTAQVGLSLGTIAIFAPKTTHAVLTEGQKIPGVAKTGAAAIIGGPLAGLITGLEAGTGFLGEAVKNIYKDTVTKIKNQDVETLLALGGGVVAAGTASYLLLKDKSKSISLPNSPQINTFPVSGSGSPMLQESAPVVAAEEPTTQLQPTPNIKITNRPIINVAVAVGDRKRKIYKHYKR